MSIKLVIPSIEHKEEALNFRKDFFDNDETIINGSEMLDHIETYEDWLKSVNANANPDTVNPEWVLTDTFFAIDENERIVGIIDFRHELNDFLIDFGHCGYSVRPSERCKGYATEMLSILKMTAGKAGLPLLQLSVERSNAPSVKTIVRNGGVLERSFEFEGEPADVYRIDL